MFISYVLRLDRDRLLHEHFAGSIEAIATGRRSTIASVDQLVEFVRATMDRELDTVRDARDELVAER